MATAAEAPSPPSSVLDHTFEGWSVWLEVDLDSQLLDHCNELYEAYRHRSGVDPFVPHVTLLYNIPPNAFQDPNLILKNIKSDFQESSPLTISPADYHFFHYPKSADNGKGFGCVISMLLLESSPSLTKVHSLVKDAFPRDERGGNFVPHMSLLYAPEADLEEVRDLTTRMKRLNTRPKPMLVRSLSLWSTQGGIKDWFRLASVEL